MVSNSIKVNFFSNSQLKKKILLAYQEVLNKEENEEVAKAIIACIQDLLQIKLGIRESFEDGMVGELNLAKPKAMKALIKYLN